MGIDARFSITAAEPFADDDVAEHRAAFHERYVPDGYGFPFLERSGWDDNPSRNLETSDHLAYYGKGYERGNWPIIRDMGDWLALHFGEMAIVGYGRDCDNGAPGTPWPTIRAEVDDWWENHGHLPRYPDCSCSHCVTIPRLG